MSAAGRALLATLLGLVAPLTPPPAAAQDVPAATAAADYEPPFDPAQVTAELLAAKVVVLPGSIARFDQQRVDALTAKGDVKVLVAPPGPIASAENKSYRNAVYQVSQDVESQWGGTVVRVVGLEVESVGQTDLTGVRHLLQTFDVTSGLEFITPYLQTGDKPEVEDPSVADSADPTLVADLEQRLQADPVVVLDGVTSADPSAGVPDPRGVREAWRSATGTDLRLVVLPPLPDGEPAGVSAADLAPAFPGEMVALFQGRWFEIAGPDQSALTIARNMTLSRYRDFLEARQIGPPSTLKVLGDQYAELTSGAVEDQPSPTQRNPLAWLLFALPWLALLLVVVFAVRNRSRRQQRQAAAVRHDDVAELAGAAAALPALADGILALDGLARSGPVRDHLTVATMRYRSARRTIESRGDGADAANAVLEGRQALTAAAQLLEVPNVPGTLPQVDAVAGAAR